MDRILIEVLRACTVRGARIEPGRVELALHDAEGVIAGGRGRLVDAADAARLAAAREAQARRALGAGGWPRAA